MDKAVLLVSMSTAEQKILISIREIWVLNCSTADKKWNEKLVSADFFEYSIIFVKIFFR